MFIKKTDKPENRSKYLIFETHHITPESVYTFSIFKECDMNTDL